MQPRQFILWGASAAALGIAVSLVLEPLLGGVALLAGLVLMVTGLHRLGRSGPDRSSAGGDDTI